jgi:hypothetical protein
MPTERKPLEAAPCPRCKRTLMPYGGVNGVNDFWIKCPCGASKGYYKTVGGAIRAWNEAMK